MNRKIIIKDIVAFLIIVVISAILYIQDYFSAIQIFIGGIASLFFIAIFIFTVFCHKNFISWVKETYKFKWSLIIKLICTISSKYATRMIDCLFNLYSHWYETNVDEIDISREFPIEEFPDGRFEIVKIYNYIKFQRKQNMSKVNALNFKDDYVIIHSVKFKNFKCKFICNQLEIIGIDDEQINYNQYIHKNMKLMNALYDLDTEICYWVIKNRKHFGF